MNKKIGLMALTGVLALASCGGPAATPDTTNPTVNLTASPASLTSAGGDVTLSGKATDNVGVVGTVTITRNGGGEGCTATLATDGSFSCTAPVAGNTGTVAQSFTYTATVKDAAGNTGTVNSNAVTVAGVTVASRTLTIDLVGVATAPITLRDSSGKIFNGYDNVVVSDGRVITGLAAGVYTITAGAVGGFNGPAGNILVDLTTGNKTAEVAYTAVTAVTRDVVVTLVGQATTDITVSDTNGYVIKTITNLKSGDKISLPDGTYNLTGKDVQGFTTSPVTIRVNGANTGTTIAYTAVVAPNSSDIKLNSANDASNRVLKIAQGVDGQRQEITYIRGSVTIDPQMAANNADRVEVFTNATTSDLNAANRIYDSRDSSGSLVLDSAKLRQGELQYIIVRYWKGTENFLKTVAIVPDNLGPQVADVIPVSKLNPEQTQKLGNWANGTVTLAFQNLDTLRDNPVGTSFLPSGVERVEWYADSVENSKNGIANIDSAKLLGTSYNSPYQVSVDTTKLDDGRHEVYAVAYDQLGNRSIVTAQNMFVLNVDNTGPVVAGNGFISLEDAGTGAVRDEANGGGVQSLYSRREGTCKIDAINDGSVKAGNIDLYDSVATANGTQYISGLARVTNLTFSNTIEDKGVGTVAGQQGERFITIDGQPLLDRLYERNANGQLVKLTALKQVTGDPTPCSDIFLDVNGLDAGEHTIRFNAQNATADLLGNPAQGGKLTDIPLYVDNQRPSNLRFSKKPLSVPANGQAVLAAEADDSVSGIYGPKNFFARDTNGTAFGGRAVQLASGDQLNYRFFYPTSGNLDLIATVRDHAGNVSSNTETIAVTFVNPRLVELNNDNFFVRRQQPNGQFLNFSNVEVKDENPVRGPAGTVHALDLLNYGRNARAFAEVNVLQGNFYQEVLVTNPLNRIGKGTADLQRDDLNVRGDQAHAPLFLISSTESAPFAAVKPLDAGLFAYHAAIIDKNGWVSEVIRQITY